MRSELGFVSKSRLGMGSQGRQMASERPQRKTSTITSSGQSQQGSERREAWFSEKERTDKKGGSVVLVTEGRDDDADAKMAVSLAQ